MNLTPQPKLFIDYLASIHNPIYLYKPIQNFQYRMTTRSV